ncbi:GDSL-type esterase/lipase family protein [Nanoarchaeota archaeon]
MKKSALLRLSKFMILLILFILISESVLSANPGCEPGKKVAVLGDSITVGGGRESWGYVNRMKEYCPGMTFTTFGYGGKTTITMLRQFKSKIKEGGFHWLIIMAGVNDAGSGFKTSVTKSNLRNIYKLAKEKQMKVIAMRITPFKKNSYWNTTNQILLEKANTWLASRPPNIDIVVDTYTPLGDPSDAALMKREYHVGDYIHPGKKGHEVLFNALKAALSGQAPAIAGTTSQVTTAGLTTTSGSQCVPRSFQYGTLSNQLFDMHLSTEGATTSIIGIARQPIAVGIRKDITLPGGAVCRPIRPGQRLDMTFMKRIYGDTQMNVEAQLSTIKFFKKDIMVHKKVGQAFLCVEKAVENCDDAKSYQIHNILSWEWYPHPNNPDLLTSSSFGVTVNINPQSNYPGTNNTDIPRCLIDAFKKFGFSWGGDYPQNKIPSQFEFLADPNLILAQDPTQAAQSLLGTTGASTPGTTPSAPVNSPHSTAADALICTYCGDMKTEMKKLYPSATPQCTDWNGCCKAKCPPNSYINPKAKYYSQGDRSNYPMPPNCVVQPAPPNRQYTYSNIGCGTFSWRMALTGYGIQKSAKAVFCGKISSIAVFPGFGGSLKAAHKKAGVGLKIVPFQWEAVIAEVKKGYPLIWDIYDRDIGIKARCGKGSKQHFMVALGASDEYLIINDPGNFCGTKDSEHMVISKNYFMKSAKHKVMYIILPPEQRDTHIV